MKSDKGPLYATIRNQLSSESEEKLRQTENWEDVDSMKDPLLLLRAIKATHLSTDTGFNQKDRQNARGYYNSLQQSETESLLEFKVKFDNAIESMEAVGQTLPDPVDQSIDFINRLTGSRYDALKVQLENNQAMGLGAYPKTLADAYNLASKFKLNGNPSPRAPAASATQSVFLTTVKKEEDSSPVSERSRRRRSKKTKALTTK